MIRVEHLSKYFGDRELFYDVSLNVNAKEKIGLIGRNGSGKSTFLQVLLGNEGFDDGSVQFAKGVRVQSLEQHLEFKESTILKQVCLALPDEFGQEWKAESILMGLGFTKEDFDRAPEEFSSGMQVRLRLAQALVSEADLLILDEPTNYLDIVSVRWLEGFLKDWKGAFILVTHDQTFMEKVVSHTVGIHRGMMRKMKGGPQKLMAQIRREEEVHERTRVKQEKKAAKTEKFIREFRAGARSAGLVQSRIKSLAKQKVHRRLEKLPDIRFNFKGKAFQGNRLLQATNIAFSYDETEPIIKKFSLDLRPGERVAIIGPNGKGKSTLLKLLVGELEIQAGNIKSHDNLRLGYFGPSIVKALNPQNSILTELMSLPNVKEQHVRRICGALLFVGNDVKKPISSLSGGEKSRVGMARLMLSEHNLLVLDEPTNHLDMESCQALTASLEKFPGTVLFVSHDERMISHLANRLVVFDGGRIEVMDKSYDQFLASGGWLEEMKQMAAPKKRSKSADERARKKVLNQKLRVVRKGQDQCSRRIEKLESEQSKNTTLLHDAYENNDHMAMHRLGDKAKTLAEEIAEAYQQLEDFMIEEESLSRECSE